MYDVENRWDTAITLFIYFYDYRKKFGCSVVVTSVISTILACLNPAANAFALMLFGVPAIVLMAIKLKRFVFSFFSIIICHLITDHMLPVKSFISDFFFSCKNKIAFRLGIRCSIIWVLAMTCWINDRAFCNVWSWLNFPYLHAAWHILIFLSAYTAIVLFAYFDALISAPEQTPTLKFWPENRWVDLLAIAIQFDYQRYFSFAIIIWSAGSIFHLSKHKWLGFVLRLPSPSTLPPLLLDQKATYSISLWKLIMMRVNSAYIPHWKYFIHLFCYFSYK